MFSLIIAHVILCLHLIVGLDALVYQAIEELAQDLAFLQQIV
jgi:hypothetical protein